MTATTMKIGFYLLEGTEEAFEAFGVNANPGNEKRQVQILIEDLNKRGGIAGRKIVPHFVMAQAASSDPQGDRKRACVEFTEDAKVFAVIPTGQLASSDFRTCLAQRRTLSLSPAGPVGDAAEMAKEGRWSVLPNAKSLERVWRTLMPALSDQGYFGKWAADGPVLRDVKVGLVVHDEPAFVRTSDNIVKPYLAKAKIPIGDEYRINATDLSQLQTQMQQAVLRFKSRDVTHVLFLPGVSAFFFYQGAESQQYRPRYGIESYTFPYLMETMAPEQAKGAMGIDWEAVFDAAGKRHPFTPQERRCFELMQKNGEDARERTSRALNFCDAIWLFEAVGNVAGRELTSGALLNAFRTLGTWDFRGFPSDFTRGTPDALYTHRRIAFKDDCRCFVYTSGPLDDVS